MKIYQKFSIMGVIFWLALGLFISFDSAAAKLPKEIQNRFNIEITRAIAELNHRINHPMIKDVTALESEFDKLKSDDPALALSLLVANKNTLLDKSTDVKAISLVRSSLQLGYSQLAEDLIVSFNEEFNDYGVAWTSVELARYEVEQGNPEKAQQLIHINHFSNQLKSEQLADARIIYATALQHIKDHRNAISIYEKTKAEGIHKKLLLLNLSTSYIKQNWWTDAKVAIDQSIEINGHSELNNRLYTLLGFSQIQFGFYRDARESFRKVELSSSYVNKALLGLGISALHQKDFNGALQAFNRLKNRENVDMSVIEAHLLHAFTLRQLQLYSEAEISYQSAVEYFSFILKQEAKTLYRIENKKDRTLLSLTRKQRLVDGFSHLATNELVKNNLLVLKEQLTGILSSRFNALHESEKDSISSYLNQSKFGLASIYDKN